MADQRPNRAALAVLSLTLAVSVGLVFGFFGRFHPALDSFSHFRLHLAALLGLCAVALFVLRFRVHALAALLLAGGCVLVTIAPFYSGHIYAAAPSDQPVYKLLQFNLSQRNPDPKAVLSMIARERPDILTLNEVSDDWRVELDTIKMAYPYRLLQRRTQHRDPVAPPDEPRAQQLLHRGWRLRVRASGPAWPLAQCVCHSSDVTLAVRTGAKDRRDRAIAATDGRKRDCRR